MRVFILLSVLFLMIACHKTHVQPHMSVQIDDTIVDAVISDNDMERVKGLQFVKKMPENSGMLFIYPNSHILLHWMKNMKIPLDIIWISQAKTIMNISENAPICQQKYCPTYHSNGNALYVLEVNAGFVAAHHIKPGMMVYFDDKKS